MAVLASLVLVAPAFAAPNGNSAPRGGNPNNPAGSQNPNANPGSQSNGPRGGNPGLPASSVGDTPAVASCPAVEEGSTKSSIDWTPVYIVGGALMGFMCEREMNREDKTAIITFICTEGEMPDPFESYAQ